jgi:ribulose-5-phosphate 4-epimerase/fuculose-1-phosphate aldolase
MRDQVSPDEWRVRVDLAAAYRLVALYGWDDLVFTHISARLPGPEHHFLINPYGMLFEEITASSLVKIDLAGNKVAASPYPINPAGFVIHSAVHAARQDAACVLHTHSLNGVAVSVQKGGLLPISQQASYILPLLAYHDYEGIALNEDEKPRLVTDLGRNHFLMLRNHGLLTVGATIADAFVYMYVFEAACAVQVRAQAGGGELLHVSPQIIAGTQAAAMRATTTQGPGALTWPGLLRKLERLDPGFST